MTNLLSAHAPGAASSTGQPQAAVRKARPPIYFLSPALVGDDGVLRCHVAYDSANGAPLCAMALAVVAQGDSWCLSGADGTAVRMAVEADVQVQAVAMPPPTPGMGHAVALSLPWPRNAIQALVLLVHEQIEALGDAAFAVLDYDTDTSGQAPDLAIDETALRRAVLRCLQSLPAADLERGVVTRRASEAAPAQAAKGFAFASCQYPAGIVDGAIRSQDWRTEARDLGPAEQSMWRLAGRLQDDPSLAFCVLTGDQVYVDDTAGLFESQTFIDDIGVAYGRMFSHKGLQRLLRCGGGEVVPLMDDHEVKDNWEPRPRQDAPEASPPADDRIEVARRYYQKLQRQMWPASVGQVPDRFFAACVLGGHDFFLADTRTDRQARSIVNWRQAEMLGVQQRQQLRAWIERHGGTSRPSFVVSSSMLLPRRLGLQAQPAMALHEDAWCGFPKTMHDVLAWLYDARAHRVIFLSGDEHLSCIARITIRLRSAPELAVVVHSVHSSALYAPYPFANAAVADFASDEIFEFTHLADGVEARNFVCEVQTRYSAIGDGFALVRPEPAGDQWLLNIEFDGLRGRQHHRLLLAPPTVAAPQGPPGPTEHPQFPSTMEP